MPRRPLSIAGRRLTLDARPDRLDLRDLPYRPPAASLDPLYPADAQWDVKSMGWVANGTDAWVVALGAPVSRGVRGQTRGKASAFPQHFVLSRERGPGVGGGQAWLG